MAGGVVKRKAQYHLKLKRFALILTTLETRKAKTVATTPQALLIRLTCVVVLIQLQKVSMHLICAVHAVEV